MTHDSLCTVGAFSTDVNCRVCDLIAKVRKDMLDKCIEAADNAATDYNDGEFTEESILRALRALQEKP